MGIFYWPAGIPRQITVQAFQQMLLTLGFSPCLRLTMEKGIEKIALFTQSGVPTHLAKQTNKGKWSSKLGREFDIEHVLNVLEGPGYGVFHSVYCR